MSKLPLGIVPRMLTREQAAEYCGCESLSAFDEWRRRGIIPGPMSGTTKWDRKLIDRWLDRRSGLISDPGPSINEWLAQQADEPPPRCSMRISSSAGSSICWASPEDQKGGADARHPAGAR